MHFTFSFSSSLQTLPYTPLCYLFSLTVIAYIQVYTYVVLNITRSVCMISLVCMFPELTIWCWTVLLPGEDYFSWSQLSSVTCRSSCKVQAPWACLHPLWHVCWCHPWSVHAWVKGINSSILTTEFRFGSLRREKFIHTTLPLQLGTRENKPKA